MMQAVSATSVSQVQLEPAELPADAIEVGRIIDAWGIKGWFKVHAFSASPEALFSSKQWYLLPSERGARTFVGVRSLPVREVREHSDSIVAVPRDNPSREQAELLKGARIFVARSSFPTTAADEYYWVDLIGLAVHNREAVLLGIVTDLQSTGPQSVLVVLDESGEKPVERMIPFVAHFIDRVDQPAGVIHVDWQPDY
jgi:16S rRNA processing protein RimM